MKISEYVGIYQKYIKNVGICRNMSEYVGLCRIMSEYHEYVGIYRIMSEYVGILWKCRNMSEYVGTCWIMSDYVVICRNMWNALFSFKKKFTGGTLVFFCNTFWDVTVHSNLKIFNFELEKRKNLFRKWWQCHCRWIQSKTGMQR